MINENITAISTGLTASGVAVIRISGDSPLKIAEKMFIPNAKVKVSQFEPYKLYTGEILGDGFKDFGMCVYFKAPKSFTGEDVVEFHSHGGVAITQGILRKIISLGAKLATRGEFTKRAFINGKLSLSSAEGLINMINSQSRSGVIAGYSLYREDLTNKVRAMQNKITDAISEIDADMDFPEEDLEKLSVDNVEKNLKQVIQQLNELIETYRTGRSIKNGVKVAICGKPNTGKSSLLNALLNYDKAIVSSVAGTTRDIVEGTIDIEGVAFNFFDTAGIRESDDEIERIGVDLSKKILNQSDLILFIIDASNVDSSDEEIYRIIKDKNSIVIVNKIDKSDYKDERADVYISALNKTNIKDLLKMMYERTIGTIDLSGDFICEERHYECLNRARESLLQAQAGLNNVPLELVSIDLKEGWDALGEITGVTSSEEIINNIFSKFCVGK